MHFYGHGKLLITGEYFVLDGADSLAVPTQPGQHLGVVIGGAPAGCLYWKSLDVGGDVWFEAVFKGADLTIQSASAEETAATLRQILLTARQMNPVFLSGGDGFLVTTALEFPREWGLGTSSTLIYMIAQWSGTDPYRLLSETMGGSGYDIACAANDTPIRYVLKKGIPKVQAADFSPVFRDNLYLVYLGQKQNSREGIARYRQIQGDKTDSIDKISQLTNSFIAAGDLQTFHELILEHEHIVATLLRLTPAKELYFRDYWGAVKSLGAWGGDFVLVTSDRPASETKHYFEEKGMLTFLRYTELVRL